MERRERERQRTARRYAALGSVACVCALAVTPALGASGVLSFVSGLALSVGAPAAFGLVAVVTGARLYRLRETSRGLVLALGGVLATAVGALYGTAAVF